jgi:hypothetical protein
MAQQGLLFLLAPLDINQPDWLGTQHHQDLIHRSQGNGHSIHCSDKILCQKIPNIPATKAAGMG